MIRLPPPAQVIADLEEHYDTHSLNPPEDPAERLPPAVDSEEEDPDERL
jgi:hypothetical protein